MRQLPLLLLCCLFCYTVSAGDYEDAWKALHQNDREKAATLLLRAMNDPRTAVDAYITYVFIRSFEGKEDKLNDFIPRLYEKVKDPNPYLFALWFGGAALGDYGKKTGHQLQLLDRLLEDPATNGSIKAAAHYFKALHYQYSNDHAKAEKEWAKIGSVGPFWQLAGPFDNLSGSGYYKDFGPLQHPEAGASFTAVNNATVTWFTPTAMSKEGYCFPYPHIRRGTAVVYAQTFVNSPDDRQVILRAGAGGTIRIWVNDRPVLASHDELVTEMDYFKQTVQLKKGYNRILIQLGYDNVSLPNYIIRLTDEAGAPVGGLTVSAQAQPYPKDAGTGEAPAPDKHFAEAFFEQKVKSEPTNLVNYILLADTYLRDKRTSEARKVVDEALKLDPDNSLLRSEYMEVLIKEENRTVLMEEVERMKEKDPNCALTVKLNIQRLIKEEKYDEAAKEQARFVQLFGESEDTWETQITLFSKQNKIDEMIKAIQQGYEKYPESTDMVGWMYSLKVNGYKDAKGGIKFLEDYLKNNYNFRIIKMLVEAYNKQGMKDKALAILEANRNLNPYDPERTTDLASYYYGQQQYDKAAEYGKQVLALAPYVSTYWENLGFELEQQHKVDGQAVDAFRKALYYEASRYSSREQIRDLEKKPSVWKAFPETDVYQAIKDAAGKTFDYDYFYILDEKFAVVYQEGASEEYTTTVIKILNQKGIDRWKETSIGYNSNNQELNIEKAEVVKKSGSVVPAEQNENQVVFTGLETGDAIVLKYKIQHYSQGRVTRYYWDKFCFNGYVPELLSRYCLLISNKMKFESTQKNADLKPAQSNYDDFKLYTWETANPVVMKAEAFMPPLWDVGMTLHISTLSTWSDVANWYSDLCNSRMEDVFDVRQVFGTLFPKGTTGLSDREKASRIYQYITSNIHYSSVSFRQGAFIPQKASVTINTKLGDCKDLSSLFVALARLSGLKANLVLVNTRDNGDESMLLPSVEFNHCVVKTWMDGQAYFLELTDNTLPFLCVPNTLDHAACLVIPTTKTTEAKLEFVESPHRPRQRVVRRVNASIDGNNLKLDMAVGKTGSLVSGVRDEYAPLSAEKQKEEMQKMVSGGYKNTVRLDSVRFTDLNGQNDSVGYHYSCTVENEVVEVGNMHMIKIPLSDVVATLDNFPTDARHFPIEYWRYEDADEYDTKVTIQAPAGSQFIDIPKGESYTFKGSTYSIQFVPSGTRSLTVIRKARLQRDNVQPADYAAMRDFLSKIVKVESKYIAFK